MANIYVKRNEATAARRRVYFHLVDATDGMTPETGEAGGQPQISVDGGGWTDTDIGVLVAIGNGRYYGELTQTLVDVADAVIETRYKSANTAEAPGDTVVIDSRLDRLDAVITSRATQTSVNDLPTNAELATALGTADDAVLAAIAAMDDLNATQIQAACAAALAAAGAPNITVASPVDAAGTLTIYQGDDCVAADNRAIAFTASVAGSPDLTGATIRLHLEEATFVATGADSDGTDWTIKFEPVSSETAALLLRSQNYQVRATLVSGRKVTLGYDGPCIVKQEIPAVA